MDASYAFRIGFRLESASDVTVEPPAFDARVTLEAARPGEEGWLFFRDTLWRGEVNDEAYARDLFERKLGVPVESVSFAVLHVDEAYREALTDEISANLELFKADDVTEVVSKYLGSSIQVHSDEDA